MNQPANNTPKIEVKPIRHAFTSEERNQLGSDLARQIGTLRGVDAEFDQVKASYKAKQTEAEAKIDSLSTALMNGFEIRPTRVRVEYRPKERRKAYFLEEAPADSEPVLVEDMTNDDFQADLLQAESKFEHREEIELFNRTASDRGVMVVGKFANSWYAALRVNIGQRRLEERLDSEQPSSKKRFDMITRAAGRFNEWLVDNLGKEAAKGFADAVVEAIQPHRERVE